MRVSVNDDGCERLVQYGVPDSMISSFIAHTDRHNINYEEA